MLPSEKVLYDCFEKNGFRYECVISPKAHKSHNNQNEVQFHVILKLPNQANYLRFKLLSTRDGHWEPDEKRLVDPWMADAIGRIIVENF